MDLVISNMNLHWVNDLPGTFAQVKSVLKPGIFEFCNGHLNKKMGCFWEQCWEKDH